MKTLIDYYDDFAEDWANRWYKNEEVLPYLKEFLKYLPKSPRVLDLCCGAGYESMRLNKLGAKVVGIDLSEKSIKIAKERNPEIEFYVKNMLEPYTDLGKFDGVSCIAGIIHINEEDLDVAFKNMADALNNNGYLFLVVRDGNEITKSTTINNVEYARKFICYTLEKLQNYTKKYFEFVKKLKSDTDWKYYIFKKI